MAEIGALVCCSFTVVENVQLSKLLTLRGLTGGMIVCRAAAAGAAEL